MNQVQYEKLIVLFYLKANPSMMLIIEVNLEVKLKSFTSRKAIYQMEILNLLSLHYGRWADYSDDRANHTPIVYKLCNALD